jgi:hypothetical protein
MLVERLVSSLDKVSGILLVSWLALKLELWSEHMLEDKLAWLWAWQKDLLLASMSVDTLAFERGPN